MSHTRSAITHWLDHLRVLSPPRHVVVLGAGTGDGRWVQWLKEHDVPAVTLIEGDVVACKTLQAATTEQTDWHCRQQVVAPESGLYPFYTASVAAESGLVHPDALHALWPNLATRQEQPREAVSLDDELAEVEGGGADWLVIDCWPALPLLSSLPDSTLQRLEVVVLRAWLAADAPDVLHQRDMTETLQRLGFKTLQTECGRNPSLGHLLLWRDRGAANALAAATLPQLQQHANELETKWNSAERKVIELETQLAQERAALSAARSEASQLAKHQELSKATELRLRNDIQKDLANAVRQIEAFVGIQNFMATGESLSHFHGWPISPDIGLFLLERLQGNAYDLIIEFGSGTSTLLFAKALAVLGRTRSEPESWKRHPLAKRVVTFEHDLKYHESTSRLLNERNAADFVELVHAPLVNWSDETGDYLYYDCDAALQKIASELGAEKARILVLVDGPPGATCSNARYPAVPHLFNRLARHHIDVVLDDASRPEEKATIELWRKFFNRRSTLIKELSVASEKGLYCASNF